MRKLIRGENLTEAQRENVLAAYVYRNTHENLAARPLVFTHGPMRTCRVFMTDDQWLREHAFHINAHDVPSGHAEPAYLAD